MQLLDLVLPLVGLFLHLLTYSTASRDLSVITTPNKVFIGALCLAVALLILFGSQLTYLGGSPYYLAAGIAIAATAILSIRRSRFAFWIFTLIYLITIPWAFWESGLDGWALAPRLGLFTAIGLWMLTPAYRGHIPDGWPGSSRACGPRPPR